jgi:hypothetical protein
VGVGQAGCGAQGWAAASLRRHGQAQLLGHAVHLLLPQLLGVGQVLQLGPQGPVIDRQRAVVASRVTVFPLSSESTPDAHALLAALLEVWPAPAEAPELELSLRPLDTPAAPAHTGSSAAPAGAPPSRAQRIFTSPKANT